MTFGYLGRCIKKATNTGTIVDNIKDNWKYMRQKKPRNKLEYYNKLHFIIVHMYV